MELDARNAALCGARSSTSERYALSSSAFQRTSSYDAPAPSRRLLRCDPHCHRARPALRACPLFSTRRDRDRRLAILFFSAALLRHDEDALLAGFLVSFAVGIAILVSRALLGVVVHQSLGAVALSLAVAPGT